MSARVGSGFSSGCERLLEPLICDDMTIDCLIFGRQHNPRVAPPVDCGVKRILIALVTGVFMTASAASNFELKAGDTQWFVINDGVMGGVSSSSAQIVGGVLEFSGRVRLDNNGGFASVRSSAGAYDLTAATSLTLRVRGDGKRYAAQLGSSGARGVLYRAEFDTKANQWLEVKLPMTAFKPTRFGQVLNGYPLEQGKIEHFGFIIANKKAETFRLELDWIRAL